MSERERNLMTPKSPSRTKPKHDELDQELRDRLSGLRNEWSLRELGAKLGVSSVSVWKILQGHPMRPSTRRRVREGLQTLEAGIGRGTFDSLFRDVVRVLGERRGNQLRRRVARLLAAAYRAESRDLPVWLKEEIRTATSK